MMRGLAAAGLALLAAGAFAEVQPLSRYQSIINRQMFGMPPDGFDPNQNPNEVKASKGGEKTLTEEQAKLQHSVRFSMINITPGGETAVGFTDNTDSKNPVHYYLKVGEQRNGWEVKEADPVRAWMRLAKGEVEVELELGGTSSGKSNAPAVAEAPKAAPALPQNFGAGPAKGQGLLGGNNTIKARRMAKAAKEAERQARADEEKARLDEERALQKEELLAMKEALQLQREESEFVRMEFEHQREEDERRRLEEAQKREEGKNEENDTGKVQEDID